MKMENEPIIVERTYDATVEKVWAAISDNKKMRKWYFDIPEFEAKPGFEFQFLAGNDDKKFLHLCKITDVIENKKIAYTWRYDGYEGNTLVTFELFDEGEKTKLKLTHEGLETFPKIADFAKESFINGWNYIIGTALPEFLKKED